jgi:choline kinase
VSVPKVAIISAAGRGTRIGIDTPKCLLELNGDTIIGHQLRALKNIEIVMVIVGFQETLVMNHVRQHRTDVIFVRNALYAETSNVHSIGLAASYLKVPFLIIDGDCYFDSLEFEDFLSEIREGETKIVINPSRTDDAVFVDINERSCKVDAFSRSNASRYEWSGIGYVAGIHFPLHSSNFVYEILNEFLPLDFKVMNVLEIDTWSDYMGARERFGES